MSKRPAPTPGGLLMMQAMVRQLESKPVTAEQLDDLIDWTETLLAILTELKLKRGLTP